MVERTTSRRNALLVLGAYTLNAHTPMVPKIDVFPAFLRLWQDENVVSVTASASRFLQLVVKPQADLYDGFVGNVTVERATQYIEQIEPLVPAIRSLHRWILNTYDARVTAFQKQLPEFA
ncbi:MAG: hypothetical protein WKF37_01215 [Bryobacteraceae bacterium]